jgi:hypothetical protein
MDRLPLTYDEDLTPGTWWGDHLEKPLIACPDCGGTLLGPPAPHTIEPNGDVNASVVCSHSGCDFHTYVTLEGWTGGKREAT